MKVLTIGDIVSKQGCDYLNEMLPKLKREFSPDIVIANGENSAVGNGVLPSSARDIFSSGVDVITLGNHALKRPEIGDYLEENEFIIRPSNYHKNAPGRGMVILDKGRYTAAVINLQGAVYLDNINNPFDAADEAVKQAEEAGAKIIIIDFHAEATSEKKALGFYLDGRVSALFGTHTHIQTADDQILPRGTGYITDIGMTGPYYSVLGVTPEKAIEKMRTNLPVRFSNPDGPCTIEGCVFEIDEKTGICVKTERFIR
ncbi:MAG: TIGR00282 family metallophosphoesterase [Eubacterium sp.]|nr:TIGR00282 family metallophosphoesterase [Eubacterium sp.]